LILPGGKKIHRGEGLRKQSNDKAPPVNEILCETQKKRKKDRVIKKNHQNLPSGNETLGVGISSPSPQKPKYVSSCWLCGNDPRTRKTEKRETGGGGGRKVWGKNAEKGGEEKVHARIQRTSVEGGCWGDAGRSKMMRRGEARGEKGVRIIKENLRGAIRKKH